MAMMTNRFSTMTSSTKSVPKWLRQRPTTGSSNMAAQTGNTFISGIWHANDGWCILFIGIRLSVNEFDYCIMWCHWCGWQKQRCTNSQRDRGWRLPDALLSRDCGFTHRWCPSVCPSVCLSVCRQNAKKNTIFSKNKQFRATVSIDDLLEVM